MQKNVYLLPILKPYGGRSTAGQALRPNRPEE